LAPPLLFLIVAAAFLWGLNPERDPREVPSALINESVPEFSLPPLEGAAVPGFSSADLRTGEVALVNVFASWCIPCRAEHPFLMRLAEDGIVPIYGLNYKDKRSNAVSWLAELGNPYVAIGADENGRVAIDWGVYGVPETFVIDRVGVIRYRHVGPLFPETLEETILPLIRSLRER
jgi:cytochrome c biogenesis protein CcmG/thiol:disulfide interchange protein DsbE